MAVQTAERRVQEGQGSPKTIDRVVVPVEGTDREFLVQQWAVELAASLDVPIHAVHVAEPGRGAPREIFEFLRREAGKWSVPVTTRALESGDAPAEFLQELRVRDLVVVGTRRLASRFHVGSFTGRLVREAPCPVQIVRLP